MNPYLQALLRRVMSQTETPGTDQSIRPGMPWQRLLMGLADPGIYGAGARIGGDAVMPPQPMRSAETNTVGAQLPLARNVMRDIRQGRDPVLTGSGFELTPAQLAGAPSSLDMLLQYLARPSAPLIEDWR